MKHAYHVVAALALATGLAGCQSIAPRQVAPPAHVVALNEPLAWVRKDGQSGRANPALANQFIVDRAACVAPPGDNPALRAAERCMAQRGYLLVPASQAAATAAQLRGQAVY